MTIFFRPCGDPCLAPTPRSERDDDLRTRLAASLGLDIAVDNSVDYEDWTEPMCLLDAAITRGVEIAILPRAPLAEAISRPDLRIDGQSCPDILLGRQMRMDPLALGSAQLAWPPRNDTLANHYGELAAFHAAAGRKLALADMPGDSDLGCARTLQSHIESRPLGEALGDFAGRRCIVKQVFPGKSLPLIDLDISVTDDAPAREARFLREVGFHFARFEGDRAALLVQDHIHMTHETRFFVIDGQIVCGAACIESHTPLENDDNSLLRPIFETKRNSSELVTDPEAATLLMHAARTMASAMIDECPALRHFVIDLALDENRHPLAVELNPIGNSGLYGISAKRLLDAILALSA